MQHRHRYLLQTKVTVGITVRVRSGRRTKKAYSANNHLEYHDTERPNIDVVRVEIFSEDFGGGELWGSTARVRHFAESIRGNIIHIANVREDAAFEVARIVFKASCKTEVGDLRTAIRTEQNVGQLEVAVDDTMGVKVFKTVELRDNNRKVRYRLTTSRIHAYQFCCVETSDISRESATLAYEPSVQIPTVV